MKTLIDISGEKFGRLTPIEYLGHVDKKCKAWKCKCDCGNYVIVSQYSLTHNLTTSCGCLKKSSDYKCYRHGLHKHRIYRIYNGMKQRCFNSNNPDYKNYGARGIAICNEWLGSDGFINFYNWAMNNGYDDSLTIERINNDGDYAPNNCKWVDKKTQQNNTRFNKRITYNGETHTLAEWEKVLSNGITQTDISHRLKHGWSIERALLTPKKHFKKAKKYYWDKVIVHNGEEKTIIEWCEKNGIKKHLYRQRINSGWSEEEASTFPKQPGMAITKRELVNQ